ncbi:MAG: hypothetical protein P8Z37_08255 [Acidobacteriota bacterium]
MAENMRDIIRLIEDGKDKLGEEYIFDRHYISSLVDNVLEASALLAFNASVLAPVAGAGIYERMDRQKRFAQKELLAPDALRMESFAMSSAHLQSDTEIQWLCAALNWLTGPLPENRPSLKDFVRVTVDEVMQHCRKETLLKMAGPVAETVNLNGHGSLKVVDFNAASGSEKPSSKAENIHCRPFGLMLLGLLEEGASEGNALKNDSSARWMLFNEEKISLRITGDKKILHIEAALYGDASSDFIYMYSQDPLDLKTICPQDAWMDKTAKGTLVWIYDSPTEHLEKQLIQLGSVLLRKL